MAAPALALSFATPVRSTGAALAMARLVAVAHREGFVEDHSGRTVGHAIDQVFRYYRHAPLEGLRRDRDRVVESLTALGPARGRRIALAIAVRADTPTQVSFWRSVANQVDRHLHAVHAA